MGGSFDGDNGYDDDDGWQTESGALKHRKQFKRRMWQTIGTILEDKKTFILSIKKTFILSIKTYEMKLF